MNDNIERLYQEFQEKMAQLNKEYFEQMRKLSELPKQIPPQQLERDRENITKRINAKTVELGKVYAKRSDLLIEELIQKIVEQEA